MNKYNITIFEDKHRTQVIDLWKKCNLIKSWNDPNKDIDRKLKVNDSLFLIVGCTNPLSDQYFEPITVELNPRLEVDDNGFYHLPLNMSSWQTLHRFSGMVYESDIPKEVQKVYWDASHYWFIGDTLGYAYKRGITDDFEYVLYDSTAITWFEGFEVPTINCCSYSNAEGEVNTMFAPIRTMKSDTVTVWMYFYNNIAEIHVDSFKVILE